MDDLLPDVVSVDVLRSLRAGDVIWVTLRSDVADEEIEVIQDLLSSIVEEDVHLIVTRAGYVESFRKMPLAELMSLQARIEAAVEAVATHRAVATEV